MNVGIIGAGPTGRAIAGGLAGAAAVLLADRQPDRAKGG
jgi:Trk K+ transport system NAD-binding subunit